VTDNEFGGQAPPLLLLGFDVSMNWLAALVSSVAARPLANRTSLTHARSSDLASIGSWGTPPPYAAKMT
jgi:hypothetical protein